MVSSSKGKTSALFKFSSNCSILDAPRITVETFLFNRHQAIANLDILTFNFSAIGKNVSTVILGASKMEQLEENLKSTEVLPLLDEDIQQELLLI
jgi:predicted aldo/keto reductase-like oxidoreductase